MYFINIITNKYTDNQLFNILKQGDIKIFNSTSTRPKVRLVILIYGCVIVEKYANIVRGIGETWGLDCDKHNIPYFIFVGKTTEEFKDNKHIISLEHKDVIDDYQSATDKHYLGLEWIIENYDTDFIYIGGDVYINTTNMLSLINQFNPKHPFFIGDSRYNVNILGNDSFIHDGGPGYIITSELANRIYPYLSTIKQQWIHILNKSNTKYIIDWFSPACDVSMTFLCQLVGCICIKVLDNFLYNLPLSNFSDKVITCHGMTRELMNSYRNSET
jgi:hypothetical protein